jgi:hypothetical protein
MGRKTFTFVTLGLLACTGAAGWTSSGAPDIAALATSDAGSELQTRLAGPPHIHVVWSDPNGALPGSSEEVAAIVRRIFGRLGVEIVWSHLDPHRGARPPSIHVVVLDRIPPHPLWRHAMGITERRPASTRSLWVLLPGVKRALGLDPTPGRASAALGGRLMSRAIGRVVAHELIHVLAPSIGHASSGLMSGKLVRAQLLGRDITVDPVTRRALRAALR